MHHIIRIGVGLGRRQRQSGIVTIIIAIVVLVVSLLAAVALMHSVDTSNAIAGSLAFRQAVMQDASRAYGDAKTKINFSEPSSTSDNPTLGFYATPQAATVRAGDGIPDVLVNETANKFAQVAGTGPTGNTISYVVERLCPNAGPAAQNASNPCIVPGGAITGGSVSNQTKDNGPPFASGINAAFRLTVRVDGPRNAIAYVQTVLR
jgi:type IV pilus assembly protein PilX